MHHDLSLPIENTQYTQAERKQDLVWVLSLYGTAIGAGVLFLPINAGLSGFIPLLIMALLAFPMTHLSHKALCRFVLSSQSIDKDITGVVEEHFGPRLGGLLTFLYFFSIFPVQLMYSVAITNTAQHFIIHQMGLPAPPRALLALALILLLMSIIRLGQPIIIKCMSWLVYPFIGVLMFLTLYLIPYWNTNIFYQINENDLQVHSHSIWITLWLTIPVMVFAFNHTALISAFALNQRERFGNNAEVQSIRILKLSHILMVLTVLTFVFSCVLSLSPHDLAIAKQQNISILSYMANHFQTPLISYLAPWIAFVALSKSFLGHYVGASEGLQSLMIKYLHRYDNKIRERPLKQISEIFMTLTCWFVATVNPNILKMIESLSGPIIAVFLFLMPMYAIATVPAMKKYRAPFSNIFVTVIGTIVFSAVLYGIWCSFH